MGDASARAKGDAFAPGWDTVLLVCRDCRKRSSGLRDPKPKEIASELKRAMREERPRPRVVLTNCLGLCPKHATAVARVGGGGSAARIAAITTTDGAVKAMAR